MYARILQKIKKKHNYFPTINFFYSCDIFSPENGIILQEILTSSGSSVYVPLSAVNILDAVSSRIKCTRLGLLLISDFW